MCCDRDISSAPELCRRLSFVSGGLRQSAKSCVQASPGFVAASLRHVPVAMGVVPTCDESRHGRDSAEALMLISRPSCAVLQSLSLASVARLAQANPAEGLGPHDPLARRLAARPVAPAGAQAATAGAPPAIEAAAETPVHAAN